jgi:hypothetical protein
MTNIIIKSENQKEEIISTSLPPEKIKKLIKDYEKDKHAKEVLKKLFGILKNEKPLKKLTV